MISDRPQRLELHELRQSVFVVLVRAGQVSVVRLQCAEDLHHLDRIDAQTRLEREIRVEHLFRVARPPADLGQ